MAALIDMAASDDTSPEQFRNALRQHDKGQLQRNGFHLIQALSANSDLAITSMKFACVHEALGTGHGAMWAPMSSHMLGSDGQHHTLSDEQAYRFAKFVLDELSAQTFPGLIYQACLFGWSECARLLMQRGVYAPLDYSGFANTTDEQRQQLATLLLEIVRPSTADLKIIRRGFRDGEPAAKIIDLAIGQAKDKVLQRRRTS